MASGYAALLGGPVAGYRLGAALGLLVPLLMVWAFIYSSHGAKLLLARAGKRVPSRAALIYLMTLVVIVGVSALRLDKAAAVSAGRSSSAYAASSGAASRGPATRRLHRGHGAAGSPAPRAAGSSAATGARPVGTATAR